MKQMAMGYEVECGTLENCLEEIATAINAGRRDCKWMACLNVHSYVVAKEDEAFDAALRSADWLVPDGIGLVMAGRMMGSKISNRITGPDIFQGVMSALNDRSGSVFFLGSTDETLRSIALRVRTDYPGLRLAGTYSPPFKPEFNESDMDAMVAAVAASGADVLWVGMTAPKQEKWIAANRERLPVVFAGAIGAVFDFYSGNLKRSPRLVQKLHLEWLHRLVMQPRRHWRRIAYSIPKFLYDMMLERAGRRSDPHSRN